VINTVVITDRAKRGLRKVPSHVQRKLATWVASVELVGLEEVRKVPGYHDEPLQGDRAGQRSIRLSKGYRAIYRIHKNGVELVRVEEVHHHEY
jgi:proteic killer suppression protein